LLPAGAVAGWGLHPLESAVFARRTPEAVIDWVQSPQFSRRQRSQHLIGFRAWANLGERGIGCGRMKAEID
jgi:hypothetical protein